MTNHFRHSFFALTVILMAFPAWAGNRVVLKSDAALEDSFVRVGDVFENAGEVASHALAPTPAAGEKLALGEHDIMRIVNAFHFDWQPAPGEKNTITFTRDATRVTLDDMKSILANSGLAGMVGNDFDIHFDTATTPMEAKGQDVMTLEAQNVQYNPVTERFSAVLFAYDSANNPVGQQAVIGKAVKMITVPVLQSRLRRGDVIGHSDIDFLRLREKDLNGLALSDEKEVVGMQLRRTVSPQTPIVETDLMPPTLVRKNDLVTLSLQQGPLSLTTRGRALDDGAKGQSITVMNVGSKKIVEAVVVSQGNAIVPTNDTKVLN